MLSRRRILTGGGRAALAALVLTGCTASSGRSVGPRSSAVLTARPSSTPGGPPPDPGEQALGVERTRDVLLRVPPAVAAGEPARGLVVLLHGAGGSADHGLSLLRPLADERGLVLVAPASRASTWDAVRDDYGPDVGVIDRALERVFAAVPVDPGRVAVGGFSDGASYALGLGLANGGLFSRVVALSPGFIPPAPRAGRPGVFVSHGVDDAVLPIRATSRRIVPALREDGYEVAYEEFDGPHTVPPEVALRAVDWLGW